jgi:hypothetical protein
MDERDERKAKLTITLTGERPVSIVRADWLKIAGVMRVQEGAKRYLNVRQHRDGRAIVHGIATRRAGFLVPADGDIVRAVKDVAAILNFPDEMVDTCLSQLPPEELF